ncbi:uncharacterized protein LOC106407489 isoform X2 [Brassica napus]|uniref:uncharacterized protein LOC106407489 isoform X2 n=1 Tax=Brassica napus TaxID=3708 RepID=UPI0006AB3EB1|nr:uncharacterized protein LOC106407489 isoform X2 [Brassica napus]
MVITGRGKRGWRRKRGKQRRKSGKCEKKIVIAPTPTKKQKKRMERSLLLQSQEERSRKELKGYLVAAMALIDMVSDKLKADELKDYLVGAMTLIGMVSDKLEDEEEADDVTVHAILIVQSNGEWNNRTVCDANICGVVQPAKIKRGWVFFSCNASSDITLRQLPESMTKLQIRPLIVQVERKIFVCNHLSSGC